MLTNASLSGLSLSSPTSLTSLYQVFVCGTHVVLQLRQFWATLRGEFASEGPYKVSIGMRLRELQAEDTQVKKIRAEEGGLKEGWEDVDGVVHHQGLPYVLM